MPLQPKLTSRSLYDKANVAASINRNEFEVLKDYVDAISKSRSGDFRSRTRWKGEGT